MATATTSKPRLPPLKTTAPATYPSELASPMLRTPTCVKTEDGSRTPISPPLAYVDFLKTISPVLASPLNGELKPSSPRLRILTPRSAGGLPLKSFSTAFPLLASPKDLPAHMRSAIIIKTERDAHNPKGLKTPTSPFSSPSLGTLCAQNHHSSVTLFSRAVALECYSVLSLSFAQGSKGRPKAGRYPATGRCKAGHHSKRYIHPDYHRTSTEEEEKKGRNGLTNHYIESGFRLSDEMDTHILDVFLLTFSPCFCPAPK